MKLSANFRLEEFLISQTAERHGIDMTPDKGIQMNIVRLVDTILQPLRTEIGAGINISSGFRPDELNKRIGGSKTSAHRFGCAADFTATGMTPLEVCILIREMNLPYDQVIHEFGRWVHVGIRWDDTGVRHQELTAYRNEGKVLYAHGLHPISTFI